MIINNIEFAFDSTKMEDLEKYEAAYGRLQPAIDKGDELMKAGKLATAEKQQVKAFKDFFIELTGADIVGETTNAMLCKAFFEDFVMQHAEQRQKAHDAYFSHKKRRGN